MTTGKCKIDFMNTWQLMYQGAESKVYSGIHANKECIAKYRFPKKYRHQTLDKKLTKERTKRERRMIEKICNKSCILSPYMPHVLWSDDCTLLMTRVENCQSVYDFIASHTTKATSIDHLAYPIALCIAELHNIGIVHGDLTTHNLLVCKAKTSSKRQKLQETSPAVNFTSLTDEIFVIPIDFGLSSGSNHSEERAVDLYVLERALLTTQFSDSAFFNKIIEVYLDNLDENTCVPPGKDKITDKLREVRARGRKADFKDEYVG